MSDDLRSLIGPWLARRPESPWIFPTRDGGQVYTSHMRQMVKRMARRAGVQEALRRSTG